MQRRGFLQSLFAAAAGLSAVGTAAASTASPKPALTLPPPAAAITKPKRSKKKPPFPSAVDEAIDLLKQCRVVSMERYWRVSEVPMMSVRYSYAGKDFEKSDLDRQVEKIVENAKPRSIEVSCMADYTDLDHLGDDGEWRLMSVPTPGRYEILVEWVGVNL
jgi:hypothetical protein